MGAIGHQFQRRPRRIVISEDLVGFLGPENLAGRNLPTEAAGAAQALGFRQVGFAAPQLIFGALAVLDVDAGAVPLDDLTESIAQRYVANEHPAIVAMSGSYPGLAFRWLAGCQGRLPLGDVCGEVVGVNDGTPARIRQLLRR